MKTRPKTTGRSRTVGSLRPAGPLVGLTLATGLAVTATLAMAIPALGHDGKDHSKSLPEAAAESVDTAVDVELLDLVLVDKEGKEMRFGSEAVDDRIVVIDFIYTTCTTVCPILSAVMARVQHNLGERLGEDAWLISISIDPTRDTPQRLNAYARKFGAGPGWIWMTGEKSAVDRVLQGLDSYSAEIVDHPPSVLIGDARSGKWTRLFGFPTPEHIVHRVDQLVAARNPVQTSSKKAD